MNMRHGMPPILKMQSLGMEPSLSVDVECTLTADFFTQMRSTMNMQRVLVNQMVLEQGDFYPPNQWPTPAARHAATARRRATCCAMPPSTARRRCGSKEDRLAHAGQGGRHHHPRRHRDQRRAAQPGAGRGRVADGSNQRRDGDRRRQGAQVEGQAARRRLCLSCAGSSRTRATTSSLRQKSRRIYSGPTRAGVAAALRRGFAASGSSGSAVCRRPGFLSERSREVLERTTRARGDVLCVVRR